MDELNSGCFFDLGFGIASGCGCIRFGKVRKGLGRHRTFRKSLKCRVSYVAIQSDYSVILL
jgi:hypothetical protein